MIDYLEGYSILVRGRNAMITAIDDIMFEDVEMGDGTKGTKITYQADISLNHIFCCC